MSGGMSGDMSGADIGNAANAGAAGDYHARILAAGHDPAALERLYREAQSARMAGQFADALRACYTVAPDDVLYAAWFFRLQDASEGPRVAVAGQWRVAVPISVALGLALWILSTPAWTVGRNVPLVLVVGGPVIAGFIIAYLALGGPRTRPVLVRAAVVGAVLAAVTIYAVAVPVPSAANTRQTYLMLLLGHLPLLAAAAVGIALLGLRSSARDRFAFLNKALETLGTAGVAVIVGGIFVGITFAMFQALSVTIPDLLLRLLIAGGAGLIPVLAVAAVYDPALAPDAQDFGHGFARILIILVRGLLPLSLLVLIIYIGVIPFNFTQPFVNRDVLIVYTVMLFAVLGLLVAVTPIAAGEVPERFGRWLRIGIVAVAALAALIGVYALVAVVYRTVQGSLTMNRLTVIGWDVVNLVVLAALLVQQARAGRGDWVAALQRAFRLGTLLYVVWGVVVVLAWPWVF